MNIIIGMTNIGKASNIIEKKDYCLDKITSASTHLLGVINDILDMSKIETNSMDISCAEFSIRAMLERIQNKIRYQLEEKKLCFALSAAQDVPKKINTDEQKLTQVITNLLSNAIKFTPDGGAVSLFIRRLKPCEDSKAGNDNKKCTLQFEVKDTGIGITEEQQSRLFRPFSQADGSITRKYGGTGLGLTISKRIIELLEGSIHVKSEPGQGTSIIFDIKAKAEDRFSGIPGFNEVTGKPKIFTDNCFKHIKILIAEDIGINREIIAALLEFTGIAIDFAENGDIAYKLFSADPLAYNLIFMDIHMPEVNGYEATKKIRLLDSINAKTIPIIAMTADVFREDISKCLEAGMNSHVGKPVNMEEVLSIIVKYCGMDMYNAILAKGPMAVTEQETEVLSIPA